MTAPKFIRVAGKLYRRVADTSPYTDVIKETEGRECNCRDKKISVKPDEKEIASAELAMQGFETQICPEEDAVCANKPPEQAAAIPHVRTIGGDAITSHLRRNWPSEALKPYNGSAAPKLLLYRGQVYVADTDMIGFQRSVDPFFEEDHIPSGQIGEVRTVCRRCGKIMSTGLMKIDRTNEHHFKYNFAALKSAPKYVATQSGDCGCTLS